MGDRVRDVMDQAGYTFEQLIEKHLSLVLQARETKFFPQDCEEEHVPGAKRDHRTPHLMNRLGLTDEALIDAPPKTLGFGTPKAPIPVAWIQRVTQTQREGFLERASTGRNLSGLKTLQELVDTSFKIKESA